MTDSALAQGFVIAIVAAGFIAALAAGAAVLTLLRRRRMAKTEAPLVPQTPALKRPTAEVAASPAPKAAPPEPAPRAEVMIVPPAANSTEPPALLIEPEAGPTQRERDIQRLIKHLKSDDVK